MDEAATKADLKADLVLWLLKMDVEPSGKSKES
jgi:hypothetical protein